MYGRKVAWQDSCEVLLGGVTSYISVIGFYPTLEYPHAAPETAVLETEAAETAGLETEAAEMAALETC